MTAFDWTGHDYLAARLDRHPGPTAPVCQTTPRDVTPSPLVLICHSGPRTTVNPAQ